MPTKEQTLEAAAEETRPIRQLQAEVMARGIARRALWRKLWKDGLSQREIATACGVTGQTVWNEIHRKDS